uniref:DEAD-box ATP-dependent RNA helicase 29 n=1 Tax=Phascolarctos cinereus TaxID=38626 RepID=A0A6P5J8K7_PHACI|nr:putative DEAD-box ATP-dependent RNA helicase 29 [Phascolarctos cinereus]
MPWRHKGKAAVSGAQSDTEDEEQAYATPKGGQKVRRNEGSERTGRAEGGERSQRHVEAQRGERSTRVERSGGPIQAKGREKSARGEGGDGSLGARRKERPAPVGGRDRAAQAEGTEGPGRGQKSGRGGKAAGGGKSQRGGKPNEGQNPKGDEKAAGASSERHRSHGGQRAILVLSHRNPGKKGGKRQPSEDKINASLQRQIIPCRLVQKNLILLVFIFVSIILFIYWTFPDLTEEEKAKLKVPRNMEEIRALGELLLKYKDSFSVCKRHDL